MFFYVDESGNSGRQVFDENQPVLSYGVLSSKTNVDLLGSREKAQILKKLGVDELHANELRFEGIRAIADDLCDLQEKFELRFDYYFIHKRSFAVVGFHSAVFDAGLNEAVPWLWYWTPLRFPVVTALDKVMNDDMLREGWDLCQLPRGRVERELDRIVRLLETVRGAITGDRDINARLKEVIADGLNYAIKYPAAMDFGIYDKKALTPNTVGFQFVLSSMSNRLKATKRKALGIIVDQQSEFNSAQLKTFEFHKKKAEWMNARPAERELYLAHPFHEGVREDATTLISHFPEKAFRVSSSKDSFGLQLTDVFLWLTNRFLRDSRLPPELNPIMQGILRTGSVDGISVSAMAQRFQAFEKRLPALEALSPDQRKYWGEVVSNHRAKVKGMNLG
jgi:hypothetical protein